MMSVKTTVASSAESQPEVVRGDGSAWGEGAVALVLFIVACSAFLALRPPGGSAAQRADAMVLFVALAGVYLAFGVGALRRCCAACSAAASFRRSPAPR